MMDTRSLAADDDRTPLALAAGLVAAVLGGLAWYAVGRLTNMEVGWVAWGIGLGVGVAMGVTTRRRSAGLAVAAATLALVGLVTGKALVAVGSTGALVEEVLQNPQYMEGLAAWDMYEAGELEPATLEAIGATREAGDTLSDALWAEMRRQAAGRVAAMGEEERRELATAVVGQFTEQVGVTERVLGDLTGFDLLWAFLALGTAFRIMNPRGPAAAEREERDEGEEGEAERPEARPEEERPAPVA